MWYKDHSLESRDLVWSRLIYLLLINDFGIDLNGRHSASTMIGSRRPELT